MGSKKTGNIFKRKLLAVAVVSCFSSHSALAAPTGASVAHGSASIATSGNTMTVTNTPNAIINWASFGIAAGETVKFVQQSAASAILNRVTGSDPSHILGALQSNGKVFLINPNGIMFGAGAQINVNGLVASTLNLSDADFLAGRMNFNADRATPGSVVNAGQIATPTGGFVYLLAPNVENSGVITTPSGEAILAAGNSVEIVNSTDPSQRVLVSATSKDVNLSQLMTQSNGNIFSVLNSGKVSANTAVQDATGKIYFKSAGNIQTTSTSAIEAKGDLNANGGSFIGFADQNGIYAGSFDASGKNGGFIETSGHWLDVNSASIHASALDPNGKGGNWLLDPFNITVCSGACTLNSYAGTGNYYYGSGTGIPDSFIDASVINAALDSGVYVTLDTANYGGSTGTGAGDITINAAIISNSAVVGGSNGISLFADGKIVVNATITSTNTNKPFNISMVADRDSTNDGGVRINSVIDTGAMGGSINIYSYGTSGDIIVNSGASLNSINSVGLTAYASGNAIQAIVKTPSIAATATNGSIRIAGLPGTQISSATLDANASTGNIDLFVDGGVATGATITTYAGDWATISRKNGNLTLTNATITNSYGGMDVGTEGGAYDLTIHGGLIRSGNNTHVGELDVHGHNVTIDTSANLLGYGGVNIVTGDACSSLVNCFIPSSGTINIDNSFITSDTSAVAVDAYVNIFAGDIYINNNSTITATALSTNDAEITMGYGGYNAISDFIYLAGRAAYVDVNTSTLTASGGYFSGIEVEADAASIYSSTLQATGISESEIALFGHGLLDIDNSIITADSGILLVSQNLWITGGVTSITADYIGLNYDPDYIQTNTLDFFDFISTATVVVDGGAQIGNSSTQGIGFAGRYVEISGNAYLNASSSSGGCALTGGCMHGIADYLLLDNGHLNAYGEMLLEAGTGIDLINGGSINVVSPNTLFFNFPFIASDGWFVDGVPNIFTGSNGSFIEVGGAEPVLDSNFFVTYGGLDLIAGTLGLIDGGLDDPGSSGFIDDSIVADAPTTEDFFGTSEDNGGATEEEQKKEEDKPQQCSA